VIDALRDETNTRRGEAPQKWVGAFIDSRDIEPEIYGFTIPDSMLAAGLNQFGASRGNLARDGEPYHFFADILFESKQTDQCTAVFNLYPVKSLGFRCVSGREHRHLTQQEPTSARVESRFIACGAVRASDEMCRENPPVISPRQITGDKIGDIVSTFDGHELLGLDPVAVDLV
jgi:hypothetical protein